MLERSTTTASPVLVGVLPGTTATMRTALSPSLTVAGVARPVPLGPTGLGTLSEMLAEPERDCASVIVTGRDFRPGVVLPPTVALYDRVPSPAAASPFRPSSWKACVALPPMLLRSAVTAMPLLAGLLPPVTATVS